MKANKSGESGNFVVLAESQEELGCGKTAIGVEVVRVFLAHADVSQLKEQYSGEAGETFAKAIHENCTARVSLKQNKEHK
ncbi:hypothetical protein [Serratia sp. JSRIV006]|uniref:hypothetical protein n=1 Tax=Serratia sp. JSRIV006 TaxID=2831896 RepID=UPI001CBA7EEC|nr:hypothetical protein [Serratia sp. JSRIV006]